MRRTMPSRAGLGLLLFAIAPVASAAERVALLVGANLGWSMDQPLRHAHRDAERLASALTELGQFAPADVVVLADPSTDELRGQLDRLQSKLSGAPGPSLALFFYSGHADERHLHLRGPPLGFDELYRRLRDLGATVKVGILDACRSGSILAAKGGRPVPSFRVDVKDELSVKGTAILTSSGADELSQEARALSGSVFSHHLVSGLRGAADEDGDARVSLAEVYRYASARTTLDTASSPSGAQRPSFRYELNGRGEVYLTRLEGPATTLLFPPDARRCYVTDVAERKLVAEVAGEPGRRAQLLVPAGSYVVKCAGEEQYRVAALTAKSGARLEVASLAFRPSPLSEGVLKGAPGAADEREDERARLKREGFEQLKRGEVERAAQSFDEALSKDLRDQEAYRGKAQVYLAMSARAAEGGDRAASERYLDAALRTDPKLEDDPELARKRSLPGRPPGLDDRALADRNLRAGHPRRYQRFGGGVSLADGHGILSLSLDYVPRESLQASVNLSIATPGVGASARWVPRDGPWSPFFGVGGQLSFRALGAPVPAGGEVRVNGVPIARQSTFERVVSLDAGFQGLLPDWQADAGLAVLYSLPLDEAPQVALMPVLSVKYVPSVRPTAP